MGKVRRAIVSVSDKAGVVSFAKGLAQLGVEILSTGGTAKTLREQGLVVTDISDYTGFPRDAGRPCEDTPSQGSRRASRTAV